MEFKGTPGKWTVKHSVKNPSWNVIGTILGGRYKIARCPYIVDVRLGDYLNNRESDEQKYNALLISKAPELLEMLNESMGVIRRLKLSMPAHPDCTEGSEFDDYTSLAQETEDEIEQLIKESTEL